MLTFQNQKDLRKSLIHLRVIEKQENPKPKSSGWKEEINIGVETDEMEIIIHELIKSWLLKKELTNS